MAAKSVPQYCGQGKGILAEPDKADGTTAQTGTQYGYGRVPHNAEAVVDNYNRELAEWERKVKGKSRPAEKERYAPPEKQSVRDQLRLLQAEGRQTKPKHRSHDRER